MAQDSLKHGKSFSFKEKDSGKILVWTSYPEMNSTKTIYDRTIEISQRTRLIAV